MIQLQTYLSVTDNSGAIKFPWIGSNAPPVPPSPPMIWAHRQITNAPHRKRRQAWVYLDPPPRVGFQTTLR